jgi:hypothetical protein
MEILLDMFTLLLPSSIRRTRLSTHLDHVGGNTIFAKAVLLAQSNVGAWFHTANLKF